MKNIKSTVVAIVMLFMALSAVSCQKDNASTATSNTNVEFAAKIAQTDGNNAWEANDAIGIYMKKAGDPLSATSLLNGNCKYLYDGAKFAPSELSQMIIYPASGSVDFIAYHPHGTIGSDYIYKVLVSNQTNPNVIDLLYSKNATGKDATTPSVSLSFEHMLSKISLNITSNDLSDTQLAGKTITATIGGMPVAADFNLANGSFGASGTVETFNMLRIPETTKLEAIIVPNNGSSGRSIEISIDGVTYQNNILDTDIFESGKRYSYTALISQQGLTLTRNSITEWDGEYIEILDITEKFTDANFRTWIFNEIEKVEANGDRILNSDVAALELVNISYVEVASLNGIEYFTGMKGLACDYNNLTSIDLSQNTLLTELHCNHNKITSIDVSKNTNLKVLSCSYNQALAELDVSNNTELTDLRCEATKLTSLDLSGFNKLVDLSCSFGNELTLLNLSGCTALAELRCATNKLTLLDVSDSPSLTYLDCSKNQLTALNLAQNIVLEKLYCDVNELALLDVSTNTALTHFYCNTNLLTSLNVSANTLLIEFYCHTNQLSLLDASANIALINFYCYRNQLTLLDMSQNIALKNLQCYDNQLATLNLSQNTELEYLYCINNKLTSLDLSQNTELTWMRCDNNQLTSLDISKNTKLGVFYCHTNPGELDGADYKLKVDVWADFVKPYAFSDPTNDRPTSALRGVWLYTPEGGAERTVTVEYVIPT